VTRSFSSSPELGYPTWRGLPRKQRLL